MKCPYCGDEMENGYIQSRDGVTWSKKKRSIAALPSLDDSSVLLASGSGVFSGGAVECYHCEKCKKMVIDYAVDVEQILKKKE